MRAPMILRLQWAVVKPRPVWHRPFHLAGTGPRPLSLKLGLSGHTPVSSTPTTTSWSARPADQMLFLISGLMPRKSGLRVVCSCRTVSGSTATTPSASAISSASSSSSFAAKPWNAVSCTELTDFTVEAYHSWWKSNELGISDAAI
nr:unnamed protein product [Digitaria exilis]